MSSIIRSNNSFEDILNTSIINDSKITIFQLICANQLGIIMEFIIRKMESYDIFVSQDDDGNTPLHLLCKNVNFLENYPTYCRDNYG